MDKRGIWKWILYIGWVLVVIGAITYLILTGINNSNITSQEVGDVGIFEIIFYSIFSEVSIVIAVVELIVYLVYKNKHEFIEKIKIIAGIMLWIMACFYKAAVEYPLDQYLVAIVGLIFGSFSIAFVLRPARVERADVKGYVKKIIKNINNAKIVSVQAYHVRKKEVSDNVVYTLEYEDSISKTSANINGILSIEYKIKKEELTTIESVVSAYFELGNNGNDETERRLIGILNQAIDRIKSRLALIEDVEEVTCEHCCDARMLLIYLSFLRMIDNPEGNTDGDSISEFGVNDGEVCKNLEVEKKLFTMMRSGLLAGAVLGENLRYIFMYKKDGYKTGRKYCVSKIKNSDDKNQFHICLIALKEDRFRGMRPDVMRAIGQIENKIETLFYKEEENENVTV